MYKGLVELVPDLVWMIVKNQRKAEESTEIPKSHQFHPILGHKQPKFPEKFLLKPPLPQYAIPSEEISIVWTTVILAIIHLLFQFQGFHIKKKKKKISY